VADEALVKGPLVGLSALLALALAGCSPLRAKAYAGYMQSELTGAIGLSPPASTLPPTNVDVEDALGADTSGSPYGRLELGAGIVNLTSSAFQFSSSGTGTLNAQFGALPVSTPVDSDIDFFNIKSALTLDLLDVGFLRISPGFGVDYLDLDVEVRATSIAALERLQVQVPAPLGFVQAEVTVGPFGITADFGAMSINTEEVDGDYLDFEGLVHVKPLPHVELFGGYRWIQFDATGSVDGQLYEADLELRGWFVGGGVTF
jgi:hypothetical protein